MYSLRVAVCCSVLQYVAVCCSVLQCVAVYCSVLQYVAALSLSRLMYMSYPCIEATTGGDVYILSLYSLCVAVRCSMVQRSRSLG